MNKLLPPAELVEKGLLKQLGHKDILQWMDEKSLPYRELMAYYRCALMEVETKFNVLNEELSLRYDRNPIESIKTRLKSPASIMDKMQRKNLPMTIESLENNISDIAGIRVICSFPEDVQMLTNCLLKQDDVFLLEQKDYITHPKESGYRSMHVIIETPIFLSEKKKMMKVEVQLRTIAMDFWASLEHKLRYKKDLKDAENVNRELRNCAELAAQLDMRMDAIRKRLDSE